MLVLKEPWVCYPMQEGLPDEEVWPGEHTLIMNVSHSAELGWIADVKPRKGRRMKWVRRRSDDAPVFAPREPAEPEPDDE